MPDGEEPDFVLWNQEAVQGDMACRTVRNDEFADVAVNSPTEQRVTGKTVDRRTDRLRTRHGCIRVLRPQILEGSLQVSERSRRVDYRRHGFGRSVVVPCARRAIQACTSSAR